MVGRLAAVTPGLGRGRPGCLQGCRGRDGKGFLCQRLFSCRLVGSQMQRVHVALVNPPIKASAKDSSPFTYSSWPSSPFSFNSCP